MTTVIVTHEVKNYSDWRKVYDADEVNRSKAGMNVTGVYKSVENPNLITIVGEAPSAEALMQFFSNPELKAAMEKGGVLGVPEVRMLHKV
ncbi:MAG: DUF3764 family protein [Prolixibacteraceae bacterium]|nr:DUF3764 family protein [Prolixibacteraceae bacterium]